MEKGGKVAGVRRDYLLARYFSVEVENSKRSRSKRKRWAGPAGEEAESGSLRRCEWVLSNRQSRAAQRGGREIIEAGGEAAARVCEATAAVCVCVHLFPGLLPSR